MFEVLIERIFLVCMVPGIRTRSQLTPKWRLYRLIVNMIIVFLTVSGLIYLVQQRDIEQFIADLYSFVSFSNALVKRYCVTPDLLQLNVEQFSSAALQARGGRQRRLAARYESASTAFFAAFTAACLMSTAFFALKPLSFAGRMYPLTLWLPFDHLGSDCSFYLLYCLVVVGTLLMATSHACTEGLFVAAISGAILQCELLADRLAALDGANVGDGGGGGLGGCFKRHELILKWFDTLVETFNMAILSQYVTSAIVFFSNLYLFTFFNFELVSVYSLSILIYSATVFCQLGLYCWFGNEIIIKSENISKAAYESKWYQFPIKYQKDMMFFIQRTQKPLIITIGKLFPNNVDTFKAIMKFSWSIFSMLLNVRQK